MGSRSSNIRCISILVPLLLFCSSAYFRFHRMLRLKIKVVLLNLSKHQTESYCHFLTVKDCVIRDAVCTQGQMCARELVEHAASDASVCHLALPATERFVALATQT
ncbi:hypothetical protein ACFE04_024773 [Oxalis oulophora]